MATIKIHIWHGSNDGKIVGIGRPTPNAKIRMTPIAGPSQGVLETKVDEEKIKTLHQTHKVDVQAKTLVEVASS